MTLADELQPPPPAPTPPKPPALDQDALDTLDGLLSAARVQLDQAAEIIDDFEKILGVTTSGDLAAVVQARIDLAGAYGQLSYTVRTRAAGQPW